MSTIVKVTNKTTRKTGTNVRFMTMTAMLSAISFILMFMDFSIPFMPTFIKMDLSELPALIGSFAMGPVYGIIICLIKNILHLFITQTGGVGELSNFILGVSFVVPAGLIYKKWNNRKGAIIGAFLGAVSMAAISVVSNYFIVYPVYYNFMSKEAIIGAYKIIFSRVNTIMDCLLIFNMPFTFIKALFSVIITFLIYKYISPIIKGASES